MTTAEVINAMNHYRQAMARLQANAWISIDHAAAILGMDTATAEVYLQGNRVAYSKDQYGRIYYLRSALETTASKGIMDTRHGCRRCGSMEADELGYRIVCSACGASWINPSQIDHIADDADLISESNDRAFARMLSDMEGDE